MLAVEDREIRPLTADEVMRMVAAGILGENEHVELLHGVLTAVSPQDPPHALPIRRLTRWLASGVSDGRFDLAVQLPLRVPDPTSLPEPDVLVTEPSDEVPHPETALLAIEVAWSSKRVDLRVKPPLYAAAGVPECWVVDVAARAVERFSEPTSQGYAARSRSVPPEALAPIAFAVEPLALEALFAGL